MADERHDNRYINKDFEELDMKRSFLGKESVLPLNVHESKKYVSVRRRASLLPPKSFFSALQVRGRSLETQDNFKFVFYPWWSININYGPSQERVTESRFCFSCGLGSWCPVKGWPGLSPSFFSLWSPSRCPFTS